LKSIVPGVDKHVEEEAPKLTLFVWPVDEQTCDRPRSPNVMSSTIVRVANSLQSTIVNYHRLVKKKRHLSTTTQCSHCTNYRAQISLGSSNQVLTRHDTFDVSSLCISAVPSLSNSTARHAHHDALDTLDTSNVSYRVKT